MEEFVLVSATDIGNRHSLRGESVMLLKMIDYCEPVFERSELLISFCFLRC